MKPITSSRLTWLPEKKFGSEKLKPRPQWWRAAGASLALAGLALCATSARAQNWIDTDLGGPAAAGYTVTNIDGSLDIFGGGSDIWNTTSQCHYRYAWASGTTWDVTMQVTNLIGVDATWTKVELMVDWANPTVGPQGSDAFIAAMNTLPTGDNEYGVDQFRTVSGGSADWKQAGTSPHPVYPNVWMRIHRNGSIFSIYYSSNNVTWTDYLDIDTSKTTVVGGGGTTFGTAWPNLVCVGIAVTAHNNGGSLADATVANVSSTFAVITAPTVVNTTVQVTNYSTYVGSEASFSFATTNNSVPNVVQPNYQWYKNGVAITNATGTSLTWLAAASDNSAQYYCVATVPPPYNTTVSSVNSATGTLSVTSGVLVTNGLKREFFAGTTSRTAVEAGNAPPATSINVRPNFDDPGGYGGNYIQRLSGYFIPPTSDNYVFFVSSDDDSDIFLSTNSIATNKVMICQEVGYSGFDSWLTPGGNGSTAAQKRSDQFSPDGGVTLPWQNGIPLIAGHLYYIEGVMHQGGGGDDFSVTYQTVSQVNAAGWGSGGGIFDNGTNGILKTASNNIAFISYPDTTPTWTLQPTNITVTAGTGGGFAAKALSGGEFAPNYQWYSNNVVVAGATSSTLNYPFMPASANGAQYYSVATGIMNGLSSTSSIVTLQVVAGVTESGWVQVEWWYGGSKTALEAGTLGISTNIITSPRFEADTTGSSGGNYANRISTLFYPPTSGNYVFFISSDDQGDLFVSTDATPQNKRMVAQETGWSNARQWAAAGGGGSTTAQKRSDQWSPDNGATTPFAAGIPMTAGQPYYIEMDHQDTGGGENAGATYKLTTDADPANGSASAFFGSNIKISVPRSFAVGFTQQPTNVTAATFGRATFAVVGTTDSQVAVGGTGNDRPLFNNKIAYQWTKNGVAIPGATSSSYSIGPVAPADNGAQFVCQIRSLGYVDAGGNDIWTNSAVATLTVGAGQVFETGYALHQYWSGNPGRASVEAGTAGSPNWIMSTPAFEADVTGTEVADNFCDDLLGYFIPSTTGYYVFFCNSDDDSDLFLSTNNSFSNLRLIAQETGYAGVLNWGVSGGTASAVRSDTFIDPTTGLALNAAGIPLTAGQQYAIQLVHHQGGGGTVSAVTAKLFLDPDPVAGSLSTIRGSQLGTYVPKCTYVNFTNQPQSQTLNNYASATFSVTAGTDSTTPIGPEGDWRNYFNTFLTYQWYKNNVAISGATAATYSIPTVLPTDNGAQIYCTTRALGYADISGNVLWATSHVANLTVITNAPQLTYASYYTDNNYTNFYSGITGLPYNPTNYIIVAFNSPMDPVILGQASTYILPAGLTILSVLVNTNDYKSVALAVSGTITLPVNVQVNSSLAGTGGGLPVANTSVALNAVPLTDADIGAAGSDPAIPGMMFVDGSNAYTILTEGSDIWGNADGFNFAYETKTNDFDVVVRVKRETKTSNWAKAGLMVRETLDANSRNWNIINDPSSLDGIEAIDGSGTGANAVECNARVNPGDVSANWAINPNPAPNYPNAWVRLKRTGDVLSAFYSTNGTSWTLQAIQDPSTNAADAAPLTNVVYVGLCATAHDNDAAGTDPSLLKYVNTADYDNYNSSYAAATVLTAKVTGSNITITWIPTAGQLLASPALAGPNVNWQPAGTGGSVTIPITGSSMFFKVSTP